MSISREKKKAEALDRVKELWIFAQTIKQFDEWTKISVRELSEGAFFWVDSEDSERIRNTVKIKETLEAFVIIEASYAREVTDKVEVALKNGDYRLYS